MDDSIISETAKEHQKGAIESKPPHRNNATPYDIMSAAEAGVLAAVRSENKMQRWFDKLESLAGIEARCIERVPESIKAEKTTTNDYVQMCLIWLSANLTANNIMIGMLGPLNFGLGL